MKGSAGMGRWRAIVMGAVIGQLASPAVAAAEGKVGQVVISTEPPGADISVDGQRIGRSPVTARDLLPGDHLVEAAWPGGATASAVTRVAAGASTAVRLATAALAPATSAPPPPPPPPAPPQIAPPTYEAPPPAYQPPPPGYQPPPQGYQPPPPGYQPPPQGYAPPGAYVIPNRPPPRGIADMAVGFGLLGLGLILAISSTDLWLTVSKSSGSIGNDLVCRNCNNGAIAGGVVLDVLGLALVLTGVIMVPLGFSKMRKYDEWKRTHGPASALPFPGFRF